MSEKKRISIDPITRIEGHLRIDCEIENGVVTNAWSSGTMWRGMENIVKGADPRDAWMICLLYTSPSPRDRSVSRMPSSA